MVDRPGIWGKKNKVLAALVCSGDQRISMLFIKWKERVLVKIEKPQLTIYTTPLAMDFNKREDALGL